MRSARKLVCLLIFMFSPGLLLATNDARLIDADPVDNKPPRLGNFTLPTSQQPGPFLSFGQNLNGRNTVQLAFETYSPYSISVAPFAHLNTELIYGISDSTAIGVEFPTDSNASIQNYFFHGNTSGLQDISLQIEQALYSTETRAFEEQTTLVGGMTLPINKIKTTPNSAGDGTPSFFLGTTYNRTYVNYFGFVSPGVLLTRTRNNVRLGSQYLYQAGIGRNILAVKNESQLFGLLEFNGQYTDKTWADGQNIPNTGGNFISLTPSLALTSRHFMTQVGVGFPIAQHLFGNQPHMSYFIAAQFTLTLY